MLVSAQSEFYTTPISASDHLDRVKKSLSQHCLLPNSYCHTLVGEQPVNLARLAIEASVILTEAMARLVQLCLPPSVGLHFSTECSITGTFDL